MQDELQCKICERFLTTDEQGLNKKIFDNDVKRGLWRCLTCMAQYLECEEDELNDKIEEFKAEGCKLFS
jgi:hypothetical protein